MCKECGVKGHKMAKGESGYLDEKLNHAMMGKKHKGY
jgi:hypothetical protein